MPGRFGSSERFLTSVVGTLRVRLAKESSFFQARETRIAEKFMKTRAYLYLVHSFDSFFDSRDWFSFFLFFTHSTKREEAVPSALFEKKETQIEHRIRNECFLLVSNQYRSDIRQPPTRTPAEKVALRDSIYCDRCGRARNPVGISPPLISSGIRPT